MTLSEELAWRGFINQTTYKDITALDGDPISFYLGVDPSADSMQIGNFATAMMVRHFIDYGHKAFLLVGGATGLIGDPDGKSESRTLKAVEEVEHNKAGIAAQYNHIFADKQFTLVDNYDWFKEINYLDFLRDVGWHVPMSMMLGREFVQSRLGADGSGISYAEFSYSLIQGYDFLHLYREHGVSLQVCGADQWGNCIAGVDLIRRVTGAEAHVWSTPLVINKATGIKFGKSEGGAIWLDPKKTSPTQFYQFWINCDDEGVADYMKIYTLLDQATIESIIAEHQTNPGARIAQIRLATEVTTLVHDAEATKVAQTVTDVLTGKTNIGDVDDLIMTALRNEIPVVQSLVDGSIVDSVVSAGLAASNSEARRLIAGNALSINGQKITREAFETADFQNGRLLLKRGKAFKDSALIEQV
jgi:tyrosyl-tRNA synthetase